MKTYIIIFGVLLSVLANSAQAEIFTSHQAAYRSALEQIENGDMRAAVESLHQAIALAPKPQAGPDEYLPYLHLSIALFEMGQTRAARDALIQSQVFGVAATTETGRQLLDRHAAEIMSAPLDDSKLVLTTTPPKPAAPVVKPASPEPIIAEKNDSKSAAGILGSEAVEAEVVSNDDSSIKRCNASISRADDKLPWFFYYQCGVDLMKAGDAKMAVVAFEMGAKALDDPRRGKRMYGMWFVDYLPYYQMALAYSQLGNWESANTAIESSMANGEFSPADSDYESFSALEQLIKSNLKHNDS
jgi:tetratricopeptide (TPR) repeat protein